jgi:hypothetical protein
MQNMTALDNWRRTAAFAGIGFVIVFIIANIIAGDTPMPDDSAGTIRDYFADNGDQYMVADFFFAVAFVFFFLPFAAGLTAYLSAAEGTPPVWSWLVIIAATIITAVGGGLGAAQGAIAYGGADVQTDETLVTLVQASYYGFVTVIFFGTALIAFSTGLVILRKGLLWNWLGWASLAYVVAALISYFALLDSDPFSALGILGIIVDIVFLVWILAVSYGMMKKEPVPYVAGQSQTDGSQPAPGVAS